MSWQSDRAEAGELASELGIDYGELQAGRADMGWTWSETLERLQDQYNASLDYDAGYDVSDLYDGDLPDVFNYYHGG